MDLVSSSELLIDDLLEDYWFFENLFTRRSRLLRHCHSDPYPSSSSSLSLTSPDQKMLDSESGKNIPEVSLNKTASTDGREGSSITKMISEKIKVQEPRPDGSFLRKKERVVLPKSGSRSAPAKIQESSTERGLIRAPSLPIPRTGKREVDYEAKKMINKLTRQFSEKIRVLEPAGPSRRLLQKKEYTVQEKGTSQKNRTGGSVKIGLQRTQTMPNNITREEDEFEDQESDSRMGFLIREALASSQNVPKVSSNMQRQRPPRNLRAEVKQGSSSLSSSPKTLRKTLSSIETTKEIQRLENCYVFDDDQLVEPRVAASGMATPPRVPKDSRKEMKDQIKFWARAVATNVRQEC